MTATDSNSRGRACLAALASLVMLTGAVGCGSDDAGVAEPGPRGSIPYAKLSEYGFFTGDLAAFTPAAGVVPYSVASPLWSDQAGKGRFLVLPEGQRATFDENDEWTFPEGTILIKTFFFSLDRRDLEGAHRIVETRLLIKDASAKEAWTAHAYVWNDEQTEATRVIAGKKVQIDYIDEGGAAASQAYLVPNTNQCKSCHVRDDIYRALGLSTHQMNRVVQADGGPKNQIEWLTARGIFDAPPPPAAMLPALPDPFGDASLETLDARARAYLHGNCSHCHRPGGGGGSSGLVLLAWEENPTKYGVCKGSVAAGSGTGSHLWDITPGFPEDSIMPFRMSSTDPEIKMPEIPNLIPDSKGVELISDWIQAMEPKKCN